MNAQMIHTSLLRCNEGQLEGLPSNPRYIKDEKFELLKRSLQESPEMLHLRELLVYPHGDTYIVIGGNMRLRAAEDGIVLDVFGGSGSTLIACEQTHRKCMMMELDPHYCDVIIARWEKLTGQTAVKIE